MKRFSIIIIAIMCLLLFVLAGCGGQTQDEGQDVQKPATPPEANDSDEYAKLLAGAEADDLLMVYYNPPQNIVSAADARDVDPEEESGENILLVNVSSEELVWEYYELSAEPETPGTQLWKDNLVPGEAVLLNSLYSEGIPNRRIHIYAGNEEEEYWEYVAGYDLTFDGAGMRGLVFIKTGDFPSAEWVISLEEPSYFAFAYTYNLEDDEYYYPDGLGEGELYIYFIPDGTGLLADAGEVTFLGWDKGFLYIGNDTQYIYEINPATSELILYRDWGNDYYLFQPEVPESVNEMYEGFLAWFEDGGSEEEAVG